MTPHPSTCQCGGSGFEKSSTDNSLKIPIPCTPSQEIVEWEKEAESIFHEIAIRGDASDEAYHIVIGKGLNFIRSLLASHSQALQEREVRCKACGSEEWQANIRDVDGEAEDTNVECKKCGEKEFDAPLPNEGRESKEE